METKYEMNECEWRTETDEWYINIGEMMFTMNVEFVQNRLLREIAKKR